MNEDHRPGRVQTAILTAVTLAAFAANSLLCRMALGAELIDPVSFTSVRLASGAAVLLLLSRLHKGPATAPEDRGSWASGVALFVYALAFSLSYVTLETGMGALLLFGTVQATMIGAGLRSGERPRPLQWLGLAVAMGGLVYLVAPGISAPHPAGALLMATAGVAWGVYSLRGRTARAPVAATAGNFARSVPLTVFASAVAFSGIRAGGTGAILAVVSGVVTSGLGYVLWYRALRGLTATGAAVVQLLVPVLAALGGTVVLSERFSLRLGVASVLILGGVAAAVLGDRRGSRAVR